MHPTGQEKSINLYLNRGKISENKAYNFHPNQHKDYEDEKHTLVPKGCDSSEVRDLKGKLKLVMTKLTTVKKEKEQTEKRNKALQEQIMGLQSSLREMVSGFSNTSSNFPTHNEIGNKFAEFYKYQCLDFFFDVLSPHMTLKGIIFFYYQAFDKINALLSKYFSPCFSSIKEVGCFETIEGPILNVMRKAFQTTSSQIIQKIKSEGKVEQIVTFIKTSLSMQQQISNSSQISQFLYKIIQLSLFCYISDPPFSIQIAEIGQKVQFNPLLHEPFDGFIKQKQQCWIVLPSVHKTSEGEEVVAKSQVLQIDYDALN